MSETVKIKIIIESNKEGEVLYITQNTYQDINKEQVEELIDNFKQL